MDLDRKTVIVRNGLSLGSIAFILTLVFFILRITNVIAWNWIFVWLPMIIWAGLFILYIVLVLIAFLIIYLSDR